MSAFWKVVSKAGKTKTGQKIISALTGGEQKTTGTEVIKSFKPLEKIKGSQSIEDVKFKSSIQKLRKAISLDKTIKTLGQNVQKITGLPVTKSGFSKGKDLPKKKRK